MQIKAQPVDILLSKIQKIKCKTGCLNTINYLVFGQGLYCSSCLSTLEDLNQQSFINIAQLAQVLVDLTKSYNQCIKGPNSQLNLITGEIQNMRKQALRINEGLKHDLKTVKDKSFALLDELFAECLKENQNQPLEALNQSDLTSSIIINQFQLLVQNLGNLRIKKGGDKIVYSLTEVKKNPQRINTKVKKQYEELNNCIQSAITEAKGVIDKFMKEVETSAG